MKEYNPVIVLFREDEYEKIKQATQFSTGIIRDTALLSTLTSECLHKIDNAGYLQLNFNIPKDVKDNGFVRKVLGIRNKEFEILKKVSKITSINMGNTIRFILLPEIEHIIEKKTWEGKM